MLPMKLIKFNLWWIFLFLRLYFTEYHSNPETTISYTYRATIKPVIHCCFFFYRCEKISGQQVVWGRGVLQTGVVGWHKSAGQNHLPFRVRIEQCVTVSDLSDITIEQNHLPFRVRVEQCVTLVKLWKANKHDISVEKVTWHA
jgi:hypothetical protein